MKLTSDFVNKKLTLLLRKTNENWYQEEFLIPEYTNQYLAFRISDTREAYGRLTRGNSLSNLLVNIFNCKELDGLNDLVFIGGLFFDKKYFVK